MTEKKYTRDHEWLLFADQQVTVGITEYAQEQLGDIVFVELPELGQLLTVGEEAAVIESVKAAGEINAPLAGTVIAVNDQLIDALELVNEDPENGAWFFQLHLDNAGANEDFMDADAYTAYLNSLA